MNFNLNTTITLNNGYKIPQMGLGVWKVDNADATKEVELGMKHGYRMFDTARQYGNEAGTGEGIKHGLTANGLKRDDIFVTTKIFNGDEGFDKAIAAAKGSLQRLQLDYVDLLLIHWPVDGLYKDTWRALEELQKQGLTKSIGVSNFDETHLFDLLKDATVTPAVDQMEFNPIIQEKKLRTELSDLNIRLEAWSPLGGGEALNNPVIGKLAKKYNKTPAQIILRWDVQLGVITIPKSVHEQRIEENSQISDFELTDQDMSVISALDQEKHSMWYEDFPWHQPHKSTAPKEDLVDTWPDSPKTAVVK